MAFKSIGQRMGFVSIADAKRMAAAEGRRKELKEGKEKEQANSERKMNLFMNRIAKKMNIPKKELLALKP